MQQNQQFIDSLIGLKKHYERECSTYSTLITDSKERSTNHVNMLLFDPTVSDQALTETIVSMRHQWQTNIRDYEHKIYHAKEQINHVNALLVDLLEMPHSSRDIDIQESTLEKEEVSSLSEALEKVSAESHTCLQEIEFQEMPLSGSVPVFVKSDESPDEVPYLAPVLLPQYQTFTQIEAVESLLKTYAGAVLHIDYIVRTLYGNSAPKIEIMSEILSLGVTQGLWSEIPDEPDCYTWDLKLIEPEESTPDEKEQILASDHPKEQILEPEHSINLTDDKERSTDLMLPDYQHLGISKAIESVLKENAPRPLNINAVAQKLFGSSDSKIRKRVAKALVKGVSANRWKRVPRQAGVYCAF